MSLALTVSSNFTQQPVNSNVAFMIGSIIQNLASVIHYLHWRSQLFNLITTKCVPLISTLNIQVTLKSPHML